MSGKVELSWYYNTCTFTIQCKDDTFKEFRSPDRLQPTKSIPLLAHGPSTLFSSPTAYDPL